MDLLVMIIAVVAIFIIAAISMSEDEPGLLVFLLIPIALLVWAIVAASNCDTKEVRTKDFRVLELKADDQVAQFIREEDGNLLNFTRKYGTTIDASKCVVEGKWYNRWSYGLYCATCSGRKYFVRCNDGPSTAVKSQEE